MKVNGMGTMGHEAHRQLDFSHFMGRLELPDLAPK